MRTISREKFNELNDYLEMALTKSFLPNCMMPLVSQQSLILHTAFMMKMVIMWAI